MLIQKPEKEGLFKLYRQLMLLDRKSIEIYISPDEKKNADFIKEVYLEWPEIKKQMLEMVLRLKEVWENENQNKENPGYFR